MSAASNTFGTMIESVHRILIGTILTDSNNTANSHADLSDWSAIPAQHNQFWGIVILSIWRAEMVWTCHHDPYFSLLFGYLIGKYDGLLKHDILRLSPLTTINIQVDWWRTETSTQIESIRKQSCNVREAAPSIAVVVKIVKQPAMWYVFSSPGNVYNFL